MNDGQERAGFSTRVARGALAGAVAGLAAAAAIHAFQGAWAALSPNGSPDPAEKDCEPPTVKAAEQITQTATGEPLPDRFDGIADKLVHYGFGALLGGVYGGLAEALPSIRTGFGTAFGAATAIAADELLVPAAGLSPPPEEIPTAAHLYKFASHLVFGAVLEGGLRLLQAETRPAA